MVAPVLDSGADVQHPSRQPDLHGQAEGEGVGRQGLGGVRELEHQAAPIGKGLELPGQLAGKTMLAQVEIALGQGQAVIGQATGDRKQHREATPHRLTGIEKARFIEIHQLVAATTPTADQATPFGHHPQQITAGRIAELPMGIGGLTLLEGHGSGVRGWWGVPEGRSDLMDASVVVDPAVDVGGVEITEHLERGRGVGLFGVTQLKLLQFLDLLLDLAGDGLVVIALGCGKRLAVGIQLVCNRSHGTPPDRGLGSAARI